MVAVILADIWRATAFSMLVYSAALSDIPEDLYDAAKIDGASYTRTLWHITLPMLRRTAFTTIMLITLPTLSVFTMVFVLTGAVRATRARRSRCSCIGMRSDSRNWGTAPRSP
jgi:multiple sugar transport system permease protein